MEARANRLLARKEILHEYRIRKTAHSDQASPLRGVTYVIWLYQTITVPFGQRETLRSAGDDSERVNEPIPQRESTGPPHNKRVRDEDQNESRPEKDTIT